MKGNTGGKMKARSGHILIKGKMDWYKLQDVYAEVFTTFLKETKQWNENEPEINDVLLCMNIMDLKRNKKPEGYNRPGFMRLFFPIRDDGRIEFCIYRNSKCAEVVNITQDIAKILERNGIENEVIFDKMLLHANKKK
ncbi:MAG: hypothetical protein QW531_01735 [Thermoplasmata archaeon]